MEMKFVELMKSARVIVEDCMKLKPEEEALIVTDTRIADYFGAEALISAIMGAIKAVGAEPNLITYTPMTHPDKKITRVAAAAMKQADAIFTFPTESITHAQATREALDYGARVIMFGCGSNLGRTDDMIYRLLPQSKKEIDDVAELTLRLKDYFDNGQTVKVTSKKGTDLTMEIGGLKMFYNTGICDKPGMLQFMPTGQTAIGVNPGTANGKLVVDASISPIHKPLSEPIIFSIKDGYVISIEGDGDAQEYKKMIESQNDPLAFHIAEVGLGTNPKAKLVGEPVEDERIYGSAHIGIGSNTGFGGTVAAGGWHSDGIFLNATMEIDGKVIVENGVFKI